MTTLWIPAERDKEDVKNESQECRVTGVRLCFFVTSKTNMSGNSRACRISNFLSFHKNLLRSLLIHQNNFLEQRNIC